MDINASDIYSFYQSSLGSIVKRTVRQRITSVVKDISNQFVCGYGYTNPYLSFLNKCHTDLKITSLIPDFLDGSITEKKYEFDEKTIHEYFLPLDPSSVDLVISTHLLEFVDKPKSSIEEIWRILKPNGYFIAFVPRRSGLWTRYDNNPFGFGRSYSTTQFKRLIEDYLILEQKKSFLHFPPWHHYANYKFHQTIEKAGNSIFPYMGGLMICVCKKIVYVTNKSESKKIPIKNIVAT